MSGPLSIIPESQLISWLHIYTHHAYCLNTTQHNTTQHNTTQHNTTQHNTTQHNTTQHNTTQHNTTQHNTTQHITTQHNTTQHNTTQHNTTHSNHSQQKSIRPLCNNTASAASEHATQHCIAYTRYKCYSLHGHFDCVFWRLPVAFLSMSPSCSHCLTCVSDCVAEGMPKPLAGHSLPLPGAGGDGCLAPPPDSPTKSASPPPPPPVVVRG